MDVKKLLATLATGVKFAEELLPVVRMIPGVGTAVGIVETAIKATGAVTEIVENIQERVAEGQIVMSSTDQSEIKALTARLEKVNDELAAYIDQT